MLILSFSDRSNSNTAADVSICDLAARTQQIMRNVGVVVMVVE